MSLGKAGSLLSMLSYTHANTSCLEVVLLHCTQESCLFLLFQFMCSNPMRRGKGARKDRISFASALR